MRILFLSSTFPDASAPARGTYNAALCCALAEGHQLRAISPRTLSEMWRSWQSGRSFRPSQQLVDCGMTAEYPGYWYTPRLFRAAYGRQMWWSIRSGMLRTIQRFRPDAIISYWAHPEGEVGLLAAREAGVPSVVIVGGTDVLILPHEPGRGQVIRRVLRESSAVVGISEGLRQATMGLGIPATQVHTIYQGIDPKVFHPNERAESRFRLRLVPDKKLLLWVGRMVPIKGLEELITSFAGLSRRRGDVHLALLGDGPSRNPLEHLVHELKLAPHITFAGAVGHDRIADWYRAADATVLSSHSEGLPNVLRESLACGTPFVTTDVGSVREISNDAMSCVVPPRNPEALEVAMNAILHPRYQQAAMTYQPRTWRDTAREMSALLDELINDSHSKTGGGESLPARQTVGSTNS